MSTLQRADRRRLLVGAAALCLGSGAARAAESAHDHAKHDHAAHDHAGHVQAGAADAPAGAITVRGLDAMLVDQDGRPVHLRRDVIGSRIAVVDFIYTTCTTVCPLASGMFTQVQKQLGDDLGRDVVLVTISVDPLRDTPERLKATAARYEAKAGWRWLTGSSVAVTDVLKGFGAYTADFTQHPLMTVVGDADHGRWVRLAGTPDPKRIVEQVKQFRLARTAAQAK